MFEWIRFFDSHNIEYVSVGANVKKNNVNIQCPYCGSLDPSHHMGVSLEGKGWACWRSKQHRGKSPAKLVAALLSCSIEHAHQIVGTSVFVPEDFMDQVNNQFVKPPIKSKIKLQLPDQFKPFSGLPSSKLFVAYLKRRGFNERIIAKLTRRYGVRYCSQGPYKGRIMFPVRYKGELVAWTGRSVYPSEVQRYKTLSVEAEKAEVEGTPPACGPIGDYFLWFDRLVRTQCKTIFLVEGPFDALKVDVLGRKHQVCATCFFTSAPSDSQVSLLFDLLPRFDKKYLLLDQGTMVNALNIMPVLAPLGVVLKTLPPAVDDPGELREKDLLKIID